MTSTLDRGATPGKDRESLLFTEIEVIALAEGRAAELEPLLARPRVAFGHLMEPLGSRILQPPWLTSRRT